MSRRIVFATFGSLGDVHPYVAIARELVRRGHRPVIATTDTHRGVVEGAGIEFIAMRPTAAQLGETDAVVRRLFHPLRGPEYLIRELVMPFLRDACTDLEPACRTADVVVTHPLTFAARLAAERHGVRWASSVLSPLSIPSAIAPPAYPAAPPLDWAARLGPRAYRATFRLVEWVARRWEAPLREFRAELGLAPMQGCALFSEQFAPGLNLALFPSLLAAPAADWPANTALCGFPRFDGPPPDAGLAAELETFMAAGEPPLVFALGSSVVMLAGAFWEHAIAAARTLGRRALLVTGGATVPGLRPDDPAIRAYAHLPYSRVFPGAAAIVHQAGIGTLAQALAAGRPQLAVPVAFDQPDNAARAVKLGVARSIPFGRVTGRSLARELGELLDSSAAADAAARIGRQVAAKDGAARAAERLVAYQ